MITNRASRRVLGLVPLETCAAALAAFGLLAAEPAVAGSSPLIRTSPDNPVPACVTPDRLMAFLKMRNARLEPRYRDIAKHYKIFGDAWRVRWDYAFFQMAVETNFLTYRTGTGRMGDVDPLQNNFAGIGTTGGGVPGDRFPDVKTGVHAQIQHLVVYSGERLALPIAPRTKLKQDEILLATQGVNHPMRFADLARRWAVDKNYGSSIEWVADSYRSKFCTGKEKPLPAASVEAPPRPAPAKRTAAQSANAAVRTIWERDKASAAPSAGVPRNEATARLETSAAAPTDPAKPAPAEHPAPAFSAPAGLGAPVRSCSVASASYGGTKAVLIRAEDQAGVRLTTLRVLDGFEKTLTESYIKARAPGGVFIGEFASEAEAQAKAREHCPAATGVLVDTTASRG